jgi:hypothetical protein
MKPICSTLLILLLTAPSYRVSAMIAGSSDKKDTTGIFVGSEAGYQFFDSEELLEMNLVFDLRGFTRTKNIPDKEFEASLTVITPEKETLTQDIKLRARGKMRRKFCSFPPIMLKIKNNKDNSVFAKGNLKLVTHCNQTANFESYLLKEYVAYKLYNLVTPYSFKTRLVKVNYTDINNPKTSYTEYGFLIENEDELAARNNSTIVENPHISQSHMDEYEMARVAFFNYMIGNTDWSVQEQHNVKVLRSNDPTVNKGIPVTYDFDYSGFVNTSYASPSDKIPITYVTDRYFKGTCFSEDLLKAVINEFEAMHPSFLEAINEFSYLSKNQKKIATIYINGFYKLYRREESLIGDINRTCLRPMN